MIFMDGRSDIYWLSNPRDSVLVLMMDHKTSEPNGSARFIFIFYCAGQGMATGPTYPSLWAIKTCPCEGSEQPASS